MMRYQECPFHRMFRMSQSFSQKKKEEDIKEKSIGSRSHRRQQQQGYANRFQRMGNDKKNYSHWAFFRKTICVYMYICCMQQLLLFISHHQNDREILMIYSHSKRKLNLIDRRHGMYYLSVFIHVVHIKSQSEFFFHIT